MIQRINKGHSGASKGRSSGFSYKPRSEKNVKDRAEQTGGKFDSIFLPGFDSFRPKVGDNAIRILPPTWEGDHEHYGMDIWVHGFVGPENGSYLCLSKMKNKPCPICDAARETKDAGEAEEAKKLEAKRRVLVWILDRDGEDPDKPILYSMGWTTDRDIAALCHNKKTGKVLLIDHPDEGYDIQFKRKGTKATNTEYYGWQVDRDSSPICDKSKTQEEVLEFITENPLTDVLKYFDGAYLQKVMDGTTEQRDEDADDEEEDRPRGKRGDDDDEEEEKSSRRSRDADDDDQEEEKPRRRRDDDEDEEEKPRERVRARRSDDDDDEDEKTSKRRRDDDDDDEEEEKSSRSKKDDDEEDDEHPRSRRGKDDDEEEDERPSKSKKSRGDDDEEEEERPRSRRGRDDDEEDDRPSRKSRRSDDDEED